MSEDEVTRALRRALSVSSDESVTREHIHGFHSYPARLHPQTARQLIESLSEPGDVVFDPFCGSGTVLVEARLQGRRAQGLDANPLSVALAQLKCRDTSPAQRERWLQLAETVAASAEERRQRRAGPTRRYGQEDRQLFAPHVLLELDGLRAGLDALEDADAKQVLFLVLSSILVKLSQRPSDTARTAKPARKRLAAGFAIRSFVERAQELMQRLVAFQSRLVVHSEPYRVWEGDARTMRGAPSGKVALLLSSPPYPGVYDYYAHHELRLRWLRLRAREFERTEMGAKRRLSGSSESPARLWEADLGRVLSSTRRVLSPRGIACFVLADSAVGGVAFRVEEYLPRLARRAGLRLVNLASQPRPLFHHASERWFRSRPRREHLVALRLSEHAPSQASR